MPKIISSLLLCLLSFTGFAQLSIIPQPVHVTMGQGQATLPTTIVVSQPSLQPSADFLAGYLSQYYGITLSYAKTCKTNCVQLDLTHTKSITGAYTLTITADKVTIQSSNAEGVFYGVQSLIQLLPTPDTAIGLADFRKQVSGSGSGLSIPIATIIDEPRFAYRGMHLDVARHFFPVAYVKKYIDYLAMHKMNYFHWHLTDDQGWRIEIKKYPLLTSVGGYRNGTIIGHHPYKGNDNTPYGGYYTQEEIKDVVRYAAKRYITIIPEIEMPGHSSAAIAAYPQLSCFPDSPSVMTITPSTAGKPGQIKKVLETWGVTEDVYCPSEYTFKLMEDVLDEVMALFPSSYIHIGGDECPKEAWKKSAFCQALIKEKGLKNEEWLQSYFVQRIEQYLNSKGRSIIGWDEILEGGLAPNATVMSWRGEDGGIAAAQQNHKVIMTPGSHVYFDHSQTKHEDSITIGGYTTVQKVYSYEPVPAALEADKAKYILGAQANMWTEYIGPVSKLEYQLFPRMSALSEVLWSKKEGRDWAEFQPRLLRQFERYHLWQAQYSRAVFDGVNK